MTDTCSPIFRLSTECRGAVVVVGGVGVPTRASDGVDVLSDKWDVWRSLCNPMIVNDLQR